MPWVNMTKLCDFRTFSANLPMNNPTGKGKMTHYATKRDANSVQILLDYGLKNGVSREKLLCDTGISPEQLFSEQGRVEAGQELALLGNLLDQLGSPQKLGIELGLCYPLTSYGIFGYAMLSSASFRSAIEFGIRYLDLTYVFSSARFDAGSQNFELKVTTDVPGNLGQVVLYRDMFAALVVLGDLFPAQQIPLTLNLGIGKSDAANLPQLAQVEQRLAGGVTYNNKLHSLSGDGRILDLPLPQAHEETARACEMKCRELLQQKTSLTRMSAQIRDVLLNKRLDISMDEVAWTLGKTSRTLHRKLKQEGTSWRELKDLVTVDLAEELLKQPLKIEQVAYQLGFNDPANFSNSFKRCTGLSPSAFRDLQKPQDT